MNEISLNLLTIVWTVRHSCPCSVFA